MSGYNDQELDGSIVEGLTDKWSSEEKRKFMEDWENDSFLFEIDSDESMEGLEEKDMTHGVDDESDEDSEVNVSRGKKKTKKTILGSQSQGSDSEVCEDAETSSVNQISEEKDMTHGVDDESDEDSEVNVSRGKKKTKKTILGSQSQGSDSEVCEDAETSSVNQISEMPTQSSQDDNSDFEQSYIGSCMHARLSGHQNQSDDDNGDDDIDECCELCNPEPLHLRNDFITYLQYMLSYCLDTSFLNDADNSQHDLKNAKVKMERKIEHFKSMLKSRAWQARFKEAMETFPILQNILSDKREGCEACARPGRIASQSLIFKGTPYDIENFESQETSLPSDMLFEVGRLCATRSKLYHRVFHYLFHLRQKCVEAVNQFSDDDVAADDVLNKCMDDEKWKEEMYRDLCSLIDSVKTWFVNKSANWQR